MKKITLFLSLMLAFVGATNAVADGLIRVTIDPADGVYMPQNGIYVIHSSSTANSSYAQGYMYNEENFEDRPFRVDLTKNFATEGITAEDLKFCYLLIREGNVFTMRNLASLRYIPAGSKPNKNWAGKETALLALEPVVGPLKDNQEIDGDWYLYQTNYSPANATEHQAHYYAHTNKAGDMDPNFSYWAADGTISATCARFTLYTLPEDQLAIVLNEFAKKAEPYYEYVGGPTKENIEAFKADKTLDNLIKCYAEGVTTFDANNFYRIVCTVPKTNTAGDQSHNALSHGIVSEQDTPVTDVMDVNDVNQMWQFVPTGDDNAYRLKNINTGKFINAIDRGNYRAAFTDESGSGIVELIHYGNGQYKIHKQGSSDANQSLYCENNISEGYKLSGWDGGRNSPSAWRLYRVENVELTANSDGTDYWATGYLPFAVKAATGDATLYTATRDAHDTSVLRLTEAANGVAAEQGFIIKSTDGTVTLTVAYDATGAATSELGGTLQDKTIDNANDYYVLSNGAQGVGFYHPNTTTLLGNKAYLNAGTDTNVSALRFAFGNEATGIENVNTGKAESNVCYDLSGRRVTNPARGIYVKNGQKVMVR